jgi:outer membrane protein OmpU
MDLNTGNTVGDPEIFISGGFGRLNLGAIADATDSIGLADVGENGVGVDNAIELLMDGPVADVSYSYTIDGITLTLSTTVGSSAAPTNDGEGDFAAHVAYKMGDFTIEVATGHDDSEGDDNMGLELGYKVGDLSLAAMFASKDFAGTTRDRSGMGVSATYALNDALSITGVYASTEVGVAGTPDQDDYGIGFSYKLGGGATITGGMGELANVDEWDIGIAMSF